MPFRVLRQVGCAITLHQAVNTLARAKSSAKTNPVSLAQRNLLRHFTFSLPSDQSVAKAMKPPILSKGDLADLQHYGLDDRTPLWLYILREASVLYKYCKNLYFTFLTNPITNYYSAISKQSYVYFAAVFRHLNRYQGRCLKVHAVAI